MRWWDRFCFWWNKPCDDYAERVGREIGNIRREVRSRYADPAECTRHEVNWIKSEIRITSEEGGYHSHREALTMWEMANQLYPGHFDEADKPTLTRFNT